MRKYILVILFLGGVSLNTFAATVDVFVESKSIQTGSVFDVQITADINAPILGWGLDLTFDDSVLSLTGLNIGSIWSAGTALDGDGLAGLAFPTPVSGTGLLLATLTFQPLTEGVSSLALGVTPTDLTEGFPLLSSGFADFSLTNGNVSVTSVPIPAAILLFGSGLMGLFRLARQKATN